ncbi:MAG TPA: chemotaxis protein CheB [Pyrinomonadaceae bacterium]|nr:chemotaxis protein CheB [Pyrinomonadaceae bacterium]
MNSRNIIVVGASAGGFEALKGLVAGLPPDFPAPVFVVWHMSPDVRGVLPEVLNRSDTLPAAHAYDREHIQNSRIYVAPPDRHMLVENGHVRVTRGPKENRFRPAIDPLFRSAAYHYGPSVIGIVLSGALDDGTSGLWTIKHRGGIAIVQDPNDAEVPSMPENAIREVAVDFTVAVAEMPRLLVTLLESRELQRHTVAARNTSELELQQLEAEIRIAAEDTALDTVMRLGELTPYTCPECQGVLSALRDGNITRFRCHTGHAFTTDSLLASVTESIENGLWSAVRGVDESIILLNHMGDHFAEVNEPRLAALFFKKANEARARNELIRKAVLSHEQFSADSLRVHADAEEFEDELAARV